ncbi:tetraspanin-19-like isoform X2 [Coffea arabica]|uniref:Tetraspanin-19-like isoform X2 n=1 Tax=Coffea arabica TaxID=13443 RepID=A0A6P6TQB7_COFAR|nr:tetraspanin-19-like isoform X2 [Coffea arabica]
MVSCSRCYLHRSIRVVNFVINAIGVAMIVYSLWLLKKWKDGVDELDLASPVPTPWFIYTCLGVGIVVCLSTLLGHSIANCISNSLLAVQISIYIDGNHEEFKNFVLFHVEMCRLISISVLVAQLIVALLAGILWAVGCEPNLHCSSSDPPNFTYSFLDDRTSSLSDCTRLPERSFQDHNIGQTLRNSFA